jgi:hypothetical protein
MSIFLIEPLRDAPKRRQRPFHCYHRILVQLSDDRSSIDNNAQQRRGAKLTGYWQNFPHFEQRNGFSRSASFASQLSPSNRAVRMSPCSPGNGESGARARLASGISTQDALHLLPLPCVK